VTRYEDDCIDPIFDMSEAAQKRIRALYPWINFDHLPSEDFDPDDDDDWSDRCQAV
jgi:hypothetical protein